VSFSEDFIGGNPRPGYWPEMDARKQATNGRFEMLLIHAGGALFSKAGLISSESTGFDGLSYFLH
jgi:hypothetical protein